MKGTLVETGVDRFVRLVKERGRITSEDAAVELGISLAVINKWVESLEEEGILTYKYSLTKLYITERSLNDSDIQEKVNAFNLFRGVLGFPLNGVSNIRRVSAVKSKTKTTVTSLGNERDSEKNLDMNFKENQMTTNSISGIIPKTAIDGFNGTSLEFLEKQAEELKKMTEDVSKLKNVLGLEMNKVKGSMNYIKNEFGQMRMLQSHRLEIHHQFGLHNRNSFHPWERFQNPPVMQHF